MDYSTLKIERYRNVAHIQLNRPEVMNALNQDLVDDIFNCFNELNKDVDVRVIVLSGSGKAFCAGGDVSFLQVINSQSPYGTRQLLNSLFQKISVVARVEKPVVGALHGFVLGAGFSLSLLCDMRVASESTIFGAEFPLMGIIPELGGTYTLPATVGLAKAMEIVLEARRFDAVEAERIGLINRIIPDEKLIDEALELAGHIAALPPLAVGMSKVALRKGAAGCLDESLIFEAQVNALCYQTEDHKEAATAFFEKRKPIFKGR